MNENNVLLVLDVDEGFHLMEVPQNGIEEYHKHLKCDCFDITTRKIGGVWFDIFCDDMGLFKEDKKISALTGYDEPALVGNLIFAHHDSEGNTTAISKDDIQLILKHSGVIAVGIGEEGNEVVTNIAVQLDK